MLAWAGAYSLVLVLLAVAAQRTPESIGACPVPVEVPEWFVADGTDRNGAPLPSVIPPEFVRKSCPKGRKVRAHRTGGGVACLLAFDVPPCDAGYYYEPTKECVVLLPNGAKVPNSIGRTK